MSANPNSITRMFENGMNRWQNASMPNIDPRAKDWELEWAGQIGKAVQVRRKELGLTAQQLADRTKELGYPMTRSTIARIEGNHRAGKMDIAEVATLGMALGIPPVVLLYPGLPHRSMRYLPNFRHYAIDALRWFTGETLGLLEVGFVEWQDIQSAAQPLKLSRQFHKEESIARGADMQARAMESDGNAEQAKELRQTARIHRNFRDDLLGTMRSLGLPVSDSEYPDPDRIASAGNV